MWSWRLSAVWDVKLNEVQIFPSSLTALNLTEKQNKKNLSNLFLLQTSSHWRAHAGIQINNLTLPVSISKSRPAQWLVSPPQVAAYSSMWRDSRHGQRARGLGFRFTTCWTRSQALTTGRPATWQTSEAPPPQLRGLGDGEPQAASIITFYSAKKQKMDIQVESHHPETLSFRQQGCKGTSGWGDGGWGGHSNSHLGHWLWRNVLIFVSEELRRLTLAAGLCAASILLRDSVNESELARQEVLSRKC